MAFLNGSTTPSFKFKNRFQKLPDDRCIDIAFALDDEPDRVEVQGNDYVPEATALTNSGDWIFTSSSKEVTFRVCGDDEDKFSDVDVSEDHHSFSYTLNLTSSQNLRCPKKYWKMNLKITNSEGKIFENVKASNKAVLKKENFNYVTKFEKHEHVSGEIYFTVTITLSHDTAIGSNSLLKVKLASTAIWSTEEPSSALQTVSGISGGIPYLVSGQYDVVVVLPINTNQQPGDSTITLSNLRFTEIPQEPVVFKVSLIYQGEAESCEYGYADVVVDLNKQQ